MPECEPSIVPEMTPSLDQLRQGICVDDTTRDALEKFRQRQHQKLTARQQPFREEYVVDLNGTQAAIRAGLILVRRRNESARGAPWDLGWSTLS